MRHHPHDGAVAPGSVTPTSDKAHLQAGFIEGQETTDSRDCASVVGERKAAAELTARAARVGLTLRSGHAGSWDLFNQAGQPVSTPSLLAAAALIGACEMACSDIGALATELHSLRAVGDMLRQIGGRP